MNVEADTLSSVPVATLAEEVTWLNESRKMVYALNSSLFYHRVPKETSTNEQKNYQLYQEKTAHI